MNPSDEQTVNNPFALRAFITGALRDPSEVGGLDRTKHIPERVYSTIHYPLIDDAETIDKGMAMAINDAEIPYEVCALQARINILQAGLDAKKKIIEELLALNGRLANEVVDRNERQTVESKKRVRTATTTGRRRFCLACSLLGVMTDVEVLVNLRQRSREDVLLRQTIVWLMRNTSGLPKLSAPDIAVAIGINNHSTVFGMLNRTREVNDLDEDGIAISLLAEYEQLDEEGRSEADNPWSNKDAWEAIHEISLTTEEGRMKP